MILHSGLILLIFEMKTSITSRIRQFFPDNSAKSEIKIRRLHFLWNVLSLSSNNIRENSSKIFSGISATPSGFKDCDLTYLAHFLHYSVK